MATTTIAGVSELLSHQVATGDKLAIWDQSAGVQMFVQVGSLATYINNSALILTTEVRARDGNGLILREASGTNGITISNSGDVGIGGFPSRLLHVISTAAAELLRIEGTGSFVGMSIVNNIAGAYPFLDFSGNAGTLGRIVYDNPNTSFQILNNTAGGALVLGTNVGTERLRITSAGNVAINITSPDSLLHVHTSSAGAVTAPSETVITAERNGDAAITIISPAANFGKLMFMRPSVAAGEVRYDHSANYLGFIANNSGIAKIDSTGHFPWSDNSVSSGKSGQRWTAVWAVNGTIQTSDPGDKEAMEDTPVGLDFVMALKPKRWKWKDETTPAVIEKRIDRRPRTEQVEVDATETIEIDGKLVRRSTKKTEERRITTKRPVFDEEGNQLEEISADVMDEVEVEQEIVPRIERKHRRFHHGLDASQVKQAMDDLGIDSNDFAGWILDEDGKLHLRYDQFIAPLIASVQTLKKELDTLKEKQK